MITVHQPILPSEITDAIIDHLQSDTAALGTCSFVCSEWLVRSRHHMFCRVQLWPWRVRRFFELANETLCTFADHVRRIEMDDLRVRENEAEVRTARSEGMMFETMRLPHPPCFAGVQAIRICNVDWTSFSMNEQTAVRNNLVRFVRLDQLEFQGVVFHDLREVGRIVNALTALQHLTANVSFKKYIQHTISSAPTLGSASNLQSLEIGTEDGIAVVLNCVLNSGGAENIRVLKLDNVKPDHLPCIETLLKKSGRNLQRLMLGFGKEKIPIVNQGASLSVLLPRV
jgi:hypothetical protein